MIIACASVLAQVPTVMMYQVQIKHGKATAQDVTVEMQLRNTQNGSAVWSQVFNLKEVKNGSVQNLGLEFGDKVNFNDGEYWLATIVDGSEMGCAKMTSVPYALVAKNVEGVISHEELLGTWKGTVAEEYGSYTESYTFNADGTVRYTYTDTYGKGDDDYTVPYHVNNTGNLAIKSDSEGHWHMYNIIKISTDEIIMGTDKNGAILKKQ